MTPWSRDRRLKPDAARADTLTRGRHSSAADLSGKGAKHVSVAAVEHHRRVELPAHWPDALHPDVLAQLDHATPYLAFDLATVRNRYRHLVGCLPGVDCYYALKCNSEPEVLETLAGLDSRFEIASAGELALLGPLGVDPADVVYSNPVKPPAHIASTFEAGVWRYAFDSIGELEKIAEHAPGSSVYVRLRVDDSNSLFPLSRKFGAPANEARDLLLAAREFGLKPYGVTFHVGSQCTSPSAWRKAITIAGRLLRKLADDGVRLEMLNMSGGFPARYADPVPSIGQIAGTIEPALRTLLPYVPRHLAVEPGRFLVAESAVLAAGVIGREVRAGENWLYLDVGAYNGLIETHQTGNRWRFPLWSSCKQHATASHELFTITGPTCDSSDTTFVGMMLPSTIEVGDSIYVGSAGAYTLSYASSFNGFAPPSTVYLGDR
jgi:ornithine decarboxylase